MQQLCLSLLVSDPIEPPPKETPPKATEEEGSVVILDAKLFYKQQEKEVAEKIKESLAVTEYAKPSSALVLSGVSSSVVQYTVFEMQLSFTVLDTEDAPTNDLGHKSDPWQVTASLLGGPPGAILMGTTTVPNRNGTAIFTNLSVSKPGEGYNLTFTITYPSYAPALTTTLEETFRTGGVSLTSGHQGVPHGQVLAHQSVLMEAVGGCGGCVGGWSAEYVAAVSRHAGCWLTECTVAPLISLSAMTPRRP
ncbi:uncharacterized protein LOC135097335 isoform X1 [Scylla paramamosain]|uniref:uncharacterized protein LOC135097144 isoform X1 n=1 Tax=Scylla paramamosain TaxID=85552 RepID=UPI003082CBC7